MSDPRHARVPDKSKHTPCAVSRGPGKWSEEHLEPRVHVLHLVSVININWSRQVPHEATKRRLCSELS